MYISKHNPENPTISTPLSLPTLSELAFDVPAEIPQALKQESGQRPPGPPTRGARHSRLPSVDKILENINGATLNGNPYIPTYVVGPVLPDLRYYQAGPDAGPMHPGHGHGFRTSHVRSLSLSNFQYASSVGDRSRSYSFSYTPARLLPSKEPTKHEILENNSQYSFPPRASIAKKRGRKKKADVKCGQCLSENTPEWRRGPNGSRTLCNACGLFYSKLTKKFGFEDANIIFAYKKKHNEVLDRIVPTTIQRDRFVLEQRGTR